ncbi:MAG: type III-A CRISPR-associated RAMP protein Csm5 [Chloroflexi bacterium 54-19]|nr:MAG: type III-A CRISPR-associated RAMP protein Csm5 [Chloroflexi bacterium 54-19]
MKDLPKPSDIVQALNLNATTLSPLHVGSFEGTLTKIEYLVNNGRVYIVDTDKVSGENGFLGNEQLEKWAGGSDDKSLTDYFQSLNEVWRKIIKPGKLSHYSVENRGGLKGNMEYRPFIRNKFYQAYLPGSSIKGALRNGWLNHYLRRDDAREEQLALIKKVRDVLGNNPQDKALNAAYRDPFQKGFSQGETDASHADLFRILSVNDTTPFDNQGIEAENIEVQKKGLDQNKKVNFSYKTSLAAECIQRGATFSISLRLNRKLFDNYRDKQHAFSNLETLLDQTDNFYRQVWQYEQKFFEVAPKEFSGITNFYNTPPPEQENGKKVWLLRLGSGSGVHSLSPGLRLSLEGAFDEEEMSLLALKQFINGNEVEKDLFYWIGFKTFWKNQPKGAFFPKSRKLVKRANGFFAPLGWLKLEEA